MIELTAMSWQSKSCIEAKATPEVKQSPKGLDWKSLNDFAFGYTCVSVPAKLILQLLQSLDTFLTLLIGSFKISLTCTIKLSQRS